MALSNEVFTDTKQYLKELEGFSENPYEDGGRENYSIGYGHKGNIKTGDTITEEQAEKLLDKDLKEKYALAKRLMPKFDTFSAPMQQQILSSVYRGSLSGSPKTIKLINEGKFSEAAKEFLNNNEYRKSVAEETGVAPRMEAVASALQNEGQNQGGIPASDTLVGGTGDPPDTLSGGPRTEASDNITPADMQTEAMFSPDNIVPSETAPGSIPVPTDPSRYTSNKAGTERQLKATDRLNREAKVFSAADPGEVTNFDMGSSSLTPTREEKAKAARLAKIKEMGYSREDLLSRQEELGLTEGQISELSLTPEYSDDPSVNPQEDKYLGDILTDLFSEPESQMYESVASAEAEEQNLNKGGPVERKVKFVKHKDLEDEEEELPDPPPGATPEEVADDVPAYLSTGEYVLPANVVRYLGLERIIKMHKGVLHELQQMEDLGLIQNVDHNGEPEDDDTEMDFIQKPEVLAEKKLMVIVKPKGMMSPLHFNGGGASGDGPAEADIGEDPEDDDDKDKDRAREQAQADFESGLVDESRNQSGGETQGGAGPHSGVSHSGPVDMSGDGGIAEIAARAVFGVVPGGRAVIDGLVAAHEMGKALQKEARERGISFDTPIDEETEAGFSGRGKGNEIGEPSDVSGGGDSPDDSIIIKVDAPSAPSVLSSQELVPGLGLIPKVKHGGIMSLHKGGTFVPGAGEIHDPSTHVHEDENPSATQVNYAPIDFEDYKAKVFGAGLFDKSKGGKTREEYRASYIATPELKSAELTKREKLAKSLGIFDISDDREAGSNIFKVNGSLFAFLHEKGFDGEEMGTVTDNFKQGRTNIFEGTAKDGDISGNEQAKTWMTTYAEGTDAKRNGITQADIGEGQTNRDVLKKIWANDYYWGEHDGGTSGSSRFNRVFNYLGNTSYSGIVKDRYGFDLDKEATADEVNNFTHFLDTGTFAPEAYAGGEKKGIMQKPVTPPISNIVSDLGVID